MTKSLKKAEAEKRLRMLGLHESVLSHFKKEGRVFYSERAKFGPLTVGILYWIDNEPKFVEAIHEFEKVNDCLVYHATHEYTAFGECLTLLYVSSFEEEWALDDANLQDGMKTKEWAICAHVVNLSDTFCSETGFVRVKEAAGGLIRTA